MITATEQIVWLITCDRPGCGRPDWVPAINEDEAITEVVSDGWTYEDGKLTCRCCLATDGIPDDVLIRDAAYEAGVLGCEPGPEPWDRSGF